MLRNGQRNNEMTHKSNKYQLSIVNCKFLIVNYFQKPTSYCKKNFQKYLRNSKKRVFLQKKTC